MDRNTFNEIYDKYSRKLYNYALWLTRNKESCNDIIQAVFIKLWNQQRHYHQDNELEAWLYTVTRNACMDFFRSYARFSRFRVKYLHETPVYETEPAETRAVWDMLDTLSEKDRSILYLHFRAGYSYKKIAEVLEIKETAVRVSAFRALEKLREKCTKEVYESIS